MADKTEQAMSTVKGVPVNHLDHTKANPAQPWTRKADDASDRAAGIKEGSAADKALDAKRGLKS